ncbi:MAG TPA: glycosyltransferase family 2 protein, partial [Chloroflexota bacterium]
MDVSIVVLNYNTREHLRTCLQALQGAVRTSPSGEGPRVEIFVVDNASSDGSADMVAAEFDEVRLIRSPRNGGFASGNNLALRRAQGDAVLLLNPDTLMPPGGVARLFQTLHERPEAGIVGPKLLRPDGSMHLACRRSFPTPLVSFYRFSGLSRLLPASRRFGRYNLTFVDPDLAIEVDSVCGACMLVRREVIDRVGLLDE